MTTVAEVEVEVEATARATAFAGTVTDPDGEEVAEGLAVEAFVGDTRCNAGEPVATYRALEDGGEVTRYYASGAHADQLAGCAAAGGKRDLPGWATARSWKRVPGTTPPTPGRRST